MTRLTVAFLVGSALAAGCSASGAGDGSTRAEDGQVIEAGEVGAFRLRIGDCIEAISSAEQFESLPVVPCDEPHEAQVFHAFELTDGPYPGLAEIDRLADEGCSDALIEELAHRADLFEIAYASFTPTEDGWSDFDDREVLCVAGFPGTDTVTDLLDTSVSGDADN